MSCKQCVRGDNFAITYLIRCESHQAFIDMYGDAVIRKRYVAP
jgi:hypothetical protein